MKSKVALVTGSGKKRVGWHVARALGLLDHQIVLHYNRSGEEAAESVRDLESDNVAATALQANLTSSEEVQRLFDDVRQRFERIDVLVNCASVWSSKKLEETTADDLRHNFDVNVIGTFLCSKHAGLMMVDQPEGGCIVNVGDWAVERPYCDHVAYFAAKGAIPTLTRTLAVELAARNPNVRVNCVHPGPVMLPKDLPQEVRQEAIDATLVRREGSPENVAQAVVALVQNDFITGACLTVDGGRTIHTPGS